jgi:hypothetical protein
VPKTPRPAPVYKVDDGAEAESSPESKHPAYSPGRPIPEVSPSKPPRSAGKKSGCGGVSKGTAGKKQAAAPKPKAPKAVEALPFDHKVRPET